MKYMIHACPPRMWYVEKYLIPSMKTQGIMEEEITIWNDERQEGNLQAFITSMRVCASLPVGVWHLQDDVIISRSFAEKTREHDHGIVCGFGCSRFDFIGMTGEQPAAFSWYSFPCIRIPRDDAAGFLEWYETAAQSSEFVQYAESGKNDDLLFRSYLIERQGTVLNLWPNIVDHVDYLIGGSVVNRERLSKINRAACFPDEDLVADLEQKLNKQ